MDSEFPLGERGKGPELFPGNPLTRLLCTERQDVGNRGGEHSSLPKAKRLGMSCRRGSHSPPTLAVNLRVCSVHVPGLMEIESYATVHQMVSTVRGLRRQVRRPLGVGVLGFGGDLVGLNGIRQPPISEHLQAGCGTFLSFIAVNLTAVKKNAKLGRLALPCCRAARRSTASGPPSREGP